MTTDNFCFYFQNRLIQTSQTEGQWYSDTSPFSIPCFKHLNSAVADSGKEQKVKLFQVMLLSLASGSTVAEQFKGSRVQIQLSQTTGPKVIKNCLRNL
jgi:hypothetical protein